VKESPVKLPPARRRKTCDCRSHPSLNCYKKHGCGCVVCRELNRQDGKDERARQKRIREERIRTEIRDREVADLEAALRGEGPEPTGRVLAPDELTRLRRIVGIVE
jgi:hypothetical protein